MAHPFGLAQKTQPKGVTFYPGGEKQLLQLGDNGLEDENTPKRSQNPGSDPMDPNLDDVDRIFDRYAK